MLTGFGLLYFIISSTRVTLIIAIILIPILLIDTSLVKIYDFIVSLSDSLNLFIAFILIVCTFILGQFSLLRFVGNRINDRKDELVLSNHIHKIVSILQYCLSGILLFIIFQIIFISHYDTFLLESVVVISCGSSIIALGLLTQRFSMWFKSRSSYIVLFYALSSGAFVTSIFFSLVFVSSIMLQIPSTIESHGHNLLYFNNPGSFGFYVYNAYVISSIIAFILTWISTALLMYNYPKKIERLKYWTLISLPLVYFLSQFISLTLNTFGSLLEQNPVYYGEILSIVFPVSKAVGGLLFGLAFVVMARKLNVESIIRKYLVATA